VLTSHCSAPGNLSNCTEAGVRTIYARCCCG
jgi:hypothetical protein